MGSRLSAPPMVGALVLLVAAICVTEAGAQTQQQKPFPTGHKSEVGTLIAPPVACPSQDRLGVPAAAQEQAMLCLVDFARRGAGLPSLAPLEALTTSAALKSRDMLACDDFSHFACGREFAFWIRAGGYTSVPCWHVGENIAWGRGGEGTPREIFIGLMRSETHRHNVLGDYAGIGIETRVGNLGWQGSVQVWTQHFGSQCEAPVPVSLDPLSAGRPYPTGRPRPAGSPSAAAPAAVRRGDRRGR